MDQLPAHVLGGILDGLPPPSLVTCGCVCKEWRAAVEARHGLLLPRSLHGIFINYDYDGEHSRLFSRPADPTGAGDIVDGTMDFVPRDRSGRLWWNFRVIVDHCNGLLLYDDDDSGHYVCNPATRRWVLLPEPAKLQYGTAGYPEIPSAMYLAFDPAVSLNYEVVRLRGLAGSERREGEMSQEERRLADAVEARRVSTEWPPAVLEVDVFSSATGRWEERQFVREGGAVVTVAYIMSAKMWPKRMCDGPSRWYAEYWKGVLYVHVREVLLIRYGILPNPHATSRT
ncbi:hypothetical protein QOZ80_9AG0683810 [Eleusine coracana subsp. coracana]|nr:hypothetical protein QOZ80_9AG0683810 [Eleusine coracana subsp. coracana]